jgi:hypothetical protein
MCQGHQSLQRGGPTDQLSNGPQRRLLVAQEVEEASNLQAFAQI